MVKNLPVMRETQVQSLGWEDPLENEIATHSSILAWKISWMEEPGGLQSKESKRVGHTTERLHFHFLFTFQYSCLENSMDRGTWQATVRRVAKSQT